MKPEIKDLLTGFAERARVQKRSDKNAAERRAIDADMLAANELIRAAKIRLRTALGQGCFKLGRRQILVVGNDVTIQDLETP